MDLGDGPPCDKKVKAKYGERLFTKFMDYLTSDRGLFKSHATCIKHTDQPPPDKRGRVSKKPKLGHVQDRQTQ